MLEIAANTAVISRCRVGDSVSSVLLSENLAVLGAEVLLVDR